MIGPVLVEIYRSGMGIFTWLRGLVRGLTTVAVKHMLRINLFPPL